MNVFGKSLVLVAVAVTAGLVHAWVAPIALPEPRPAPPTPGEAPRDAFSITLAEAKSRHEDPGVVFIDASRRDEHAAGRIPGAVSLPLTAFAGGAVPDEVDYFDSGSPIVVYCPTAQCDAARLVAGFLRALGFTQVFVFHDGFRAWEGAGYPVERG